MKKLIYVTGIIIMISVILFFSGSNIFSSNTPVWGKDGKPYDFEKVKEDFRSGKLNIADISKEYYMHPEFIFEDYHNNSNQTKIGQYGYGAIPSEVSYNVFGFNQGQYLNVSTLVIASDNIKNKQNLALSLESPDDELFNTNVEPSEIVLSPTYPEINASSNWVYKIKMTIVAKHDIPEGQYRFRLKAISASPVQPSKFFDFVLNSFKTKT